MPEIPVTLLLEERAALAMNAVSSLPDEDLGGIPFFSANLLMKPARLRHGDWDYGSSHGRLTDACLLARHMTGDSQWLPVEQAYKKTLIDLLADDGLTYRRTHPRGHWEPNANLIDQRGTLLALVTWFLDDQDERAKMAADNQIAGLKNIAVKERDVWFYPASEYTHDGWPSKNAINLHLAPDPASFSGRLIMPLLRYHEATGNSDALELAGWFAKLIVEFSGVYNADGSFNSARAYRSGHFHTRLGTLEGLARLARFTGDHALSHYVKRSYDWALTQATAFGWTPGDLTEQRYEHETCSLVDFIGVGATLASCGHTHYWGVIERFLRNHLAESQLLDLDWVQSAPDRSGDIPGWITYVNVGERVLGAFAGYGAPNDYVSDVALGRGHTDDVQGCCVGSGVRGLFYGWNNIAVGDENLMRVNLLLSRGNSYLDVISYLPYEGRVELRINEACREIRVRIPEWAGYTKLQLRRGEDHRSGTERIWAPDGYLSIPDARPGEVVTITFPVSVHSTTEYAAGQEFHTQWRGDDVVGISPEGRSRPMYSNRKITDQAPLRSFDLSRPATEWAW